MGDFVSESERIEGYREHMAKTCRWFERIARVIGALATVSMAYLSIASIAYYFIPGASVGLRLNEALSTIPCSLLVIFVCFFSWRLLRRLAKGESPFTSKFVRGLDALVVSFAVFALVEFVLSLYGEGGLFLPFVGYECLMSASGLALASTLMACVMFVLAFVFRYGVLLQQQNEYLI